jgi:hypothetical protein
MLRRSIVLSCLILVLITLAVAYSTCSGYMVWYLPIRSRIFLDDHETEGYVHRCLTDHRLVMITIRNNPKPETYLVWLEHRHNIVDCGQFHPPPYLPIPIGDLSPPCSMFNIDPTEVRDPPMTQTLLTTPMSVEFSTASGHKIRAQW